VKLDWLAACTAVAPDKLALLMDGRSWRYAELNRLVENLCVHLRAGMAATVQPVAGGTSPPTINSANVVAALLPNSLETVCLIHALARLGLVLLPLNTRLTAVELEWQLAQTGCRRLFYHEETEALAQQLSSAQRQLSPLDGEMLTQAPGGLDGEEWPLTFGDSPQAIVYTSGTSGRPKGAVLTFANHFWSATASAFRLGTLPEDRWLSSLPLYHVGGLAVVFRCALYGTTAVIHPRFDVAAVNQSLDRDEITLLSLVPTMLQRLLERRDYWPASLRLILLGGAAADPELIERGNSLPRQLPITHYRLPSANAPLVAPTYGLTEAASQVATMLPADAARKPGSVGKPLLFTQVRIVDENGQELPAGERGEIVVTGPTVMAGYFSQESAANGQQSTANSQQSTANSQQSTANSQQSTANLQPSTFNLQPSTFNLQPSTFNLHPFSTISTGDIGYLDEDGDLWLVQRRTDLIVSGGENVYPAEVEAVLKAHPAVANACVVGVPHPEWGRQVAAAVVRQPGMTLTESELSDFCREQLAGYKRPRTIRFMENLPETASGKIHRQAVAAQLGEEQA
jgi:o-succinylbenzoate---CoA ligase